MIINKIYLTIQLIALFMGFNKRERREFKFDEIKDFKAISFQIISRIDSSSLYKDVNLIMEIEDTLRIEKSEIKLTKDVEIYHSCFNYLNYYESNNKCEYIRYYDTSICINQILKNNINKYESNNQVIIFNKSIYEFNINDRDYILMGASDRAFYRNIETNYWILLEVESKEIRNIYSFIDGYCESPKCFGDFDNDGDLDYLHWGFNKNKIELYSLSGNEFYINNKEYIYVEPSISERVRIEKGEEVTFSLLNKRKSKWSNFIY